MAHHALKIRSTMASVGLIIAEATAISQQFTGSIIANSGYTQKTASIAIQNGNADLIAFGRPVISNPDLVEWFANGWSLNPPADPGVWYSLGQEGYIDFPTYSPPKH
jgi:2,4-dienoyl-CoA reductase-like NADH-dependent reductase (Old Yellow Enzyme family)